MPFRQVPTSLPQAQFQDQASPLTEGMLHASATFAELWPRLAQIKLENRRFEGNMAERKAEFQQRESDRQDRARMWSTNRQDAIDQRRDQAAGTLSERQHQDDQNAARYGAYTGDDPQLKAISDQVRQERSQAAQDRSGKAEQGFDDDAHKRAAGELAPAGIGYKAAMVPKKDAQGNTIGMVAGKVPIEDEQEREDQINRINSRALELRGKNFKPVPAVNPDAPGPGAPGAGAPGPMAQQPSDSPQLQRMWSAGTPAAAPAAPLPPHLQAQQVMQDPQRQQDAVMWRQQQGASTAAPLIAAPHLQAVESDPTWKAHLDKKFPARGTDPQQRIAADAYVAGFKLPDQQPTAAAQAPAPAGP